MQRDDSIHERLADRLANILTKLNMGYQLSIKELASEFGVSTRTISRDFDRINTYLPLLQDNENKKFYLDLNYLGKIAPKDIRNFAQLSGISHLYPSLDMSFLRELLDSRAHQIYSAKGYSFEDASQFKELFKVLGKAIQEQRQIGFLYKGESRLVQPYRLIHHHGSWYLAAVRKDQLRTYRISHIQLMHATHEYPQFIPDQDIVKVVEDDDSIWFGQDKHVLKSNDIQISMDGKGRWVDNVMVERLWRSVKYEEVYLKAYSNVLDAKKQLNAYFEFYNLKRPHSSLDKMTPDEFYYDQLPQQNKVA